MEGGRFELPNPKERIYSPPRLATSLPLRTIKLKWWRMTGSNRRPSACKADALPAELILQICNDPDGTRTRVTAVKGRCLNHLTNGPDLTIEHIYYYTRSFSKSKYFLKKFTQ